MECSELWTILKSKGINFFTGVPDSTFKCWMSFLNDHHNRELTNIISCNECEAIALAAGYHLATGKFGVAYMQNSGEGKTINPLTSLCDPKVYSIPVLLMIGWRGEPGKKDEPQHKKMGEITTDLLNVLGIPYDILPAEKDSANSSISKAVEYLNSSKAPYALIIKNDVLRDYNTKKETKEKAFMTREEAIKIVTDVLNPKDVIVSTTGRTSRELFEYRISKGVKPNDFYTVGSMGCAASIAHGIALQKPDRKILVFDGDGAVIMQMGALATIGHYKPKNFYHILFDNESHDSTGGQPTVSSTINFEKLAVSCGYSFTCTVRKKEDLKKSVESLYSAEGPVMIIVKIKKGARSDLGRPTTTPLENKESFMRFLSS